MLPSHSTHMHPSFLSFVFLIHKSFRDYIGLKKKYPIYHCYSGKSHQLACLLQIATCENTLSPMYLDSQKGNRSRYVTKACSIPYKTSIPNGKKEVLQPPQCKMEVNAWEIKPPDFSYKLYKSLRFPEKSSRTSKEEQGRGKKSNFPETMLHLPNIRNHSKKVKSPPFITTFPHLDSHKAKLMFVKSGKYPNGVYLNPKPHDFRQVQKCV